MQDGQTGQQTLIAMLIQRIKETAKHTIVAEAMHN